MNMHSRRVRSANTLAQPASGSRASARLAGGSVLLMLLAGLGVWAWCWDAPLPESLQSHSVGSVEQKARGQDRAIPQSGSGSVLNPASVRRTAAPAAQPVVLRFVCAESGVDVACTRVTVSPLLADDARGSRSDEALRRSGSLIGIDPECVGTQVVVDVRAEGYARLRARLIPNAGENLVALVPGGNVCVRCVDAHGLPVSGARIALLPPVQSESAAGLSDYGPDWPQLAIGGDQAAGSATVPTASTLPNMAHVAGVWRLRGVVWQLDALRSVAASMSGCGPWMQSSGSDGLVTWHNVPAVPGYRWGLLPEQLGVVEPVHEQVQYRAVDGAVKVEDPPPYGLSGCFAIEPAATCEWTAQLQEAASVCGHVVPLPGSTSAAVRLYEVVTFRGGDHVGLVAFEFRATTQTGDVGGYRFTFENLTPGDYVVRASWMGNARDVYFANEAFRIEAGDKLDLEDVPRLTGPATTTLQLGVSLDGEQASPKMVFSGVEAPLAHLYFEVVADSARPEHSICELLALPLGSEFVFHGLPAGRLVARALCPPGQPFDPAAISSVQRGDFEQHLDTINGAVAVNLRATSGIRRALEVFDTNGMPVAAPTLWARSCGADGRVLEAPRNLALEWQSVAGSERLSAELNLPPGDYELACRAVADTTGVGMFGSIRVHFDTNPQANGSIKLRLLPASRASGTVVDGANRPTAVMLQWRAVTGLETAAHGWPLSSSSNGEGEFSLLGVPPGARLVGQHGTPDIDAAQMGLDQVGLKLRWHGR